MNSKALLMLIVLGLAYGGFIWAHRVFDAGAVDHGSGDETVADATPWVVMLMREGQGALGRMRVDMRKRPGGTEELLKILPATDEPWLKDVEQLLEGAGPKEKPLPGNLRVAFPRGDQSSAPQALQVNRDGIGKVWLKLRELEENGSTKVLASFEGAVNVPVSWPEGTTFRPGGRYQLEASSSEGQGPFALSAFRIIDASESRSLRQAMAVLKMSIHEVRPRVFMQAAVAMSRGLYDDAHGILFSRLPQQAGASEERGLIERLAFLSFHRGNRVHTEQMLKRLKELR